MKYLLTGIFISFFCLSTVAQDVPIFTHYYTNQYIYNPAYAGIEGRPVVSLTYRNQWIGIEDSPVTSNFTFHTPVFGGLNMGLNVTQDNFGIFQNSTALLSVGYTVPLGFNQYVSFGISGGGKFQSIDFTNVNPSDPALVGILDKNTQLDGNLGLAYHIGGLNLGFSMQNIFNTRTFPVDQFDAGEFGLIRNYILTADYMLYFGNDDYIFQPYGSYRSYEGYESQFEAGGVFHIKHLLWVGGSYRQNYGIVTLIGLKLKSSFSIGYAYEIPSTKATGISKASHEVNLNFAFGKKKDRSKKYATFLASQKPIKPKKKKKKPPVIVDPIVTDTVNVEENAIIPPTAIESTLDSMNQGGNKIRLIVEGGFINKGTKTQEIDTAKIEPEKPVEIEQEKPVVVPPAVVTKKGGHPFELDRGHYIVVGAFGVYKNAIRTNDKLLSQGFNSDFGFSSDRNIFYVYIIDENSATGARKKRDELRKLPAFSNAWYLVVE